MTEPREAWGRQGLPDIPIDMIAVALLGGLVALWWEGYLAKLLFTIFG